MSNTAILFSGQGAQYPNMGQALAKASKEASEIYDLASATVGYDILKLDEAALNDTKYAQIATFTLSMAAYHALKARLEPDQLEIHTAPLAGFSLGEYSALTAASIIDLSDALKLIAYRSEVMAKAANQNKGAMFAILGLDDEVILNALNEDIYKGKVFPANFNAPGQLVIAGYEEACLQAAEQFKNLGARRALRLNVSGAFHTKLMDLAAKQLSEYANSINFKTTKQTVYSNVFAKPLVVDEQFTKYLGTHMTSPVLWTKSITQLKNLGIKQYIELGPGKTLLGLVKRVDRQASLLNIEDEKSLDETIAALKSIQD